MSADLRARFEGFRARAGAAGPVPDAPPAGGPAAPPRPLPGGVWATVETPDGPVPVRDDHRALPFVSQLRGPWPSRIAACDLGPVEGWRWVDLETTGLAGARAFLAAVGRVEGDGLALRQYLLEDLDREPAFLTAVSADLAGGGAFVSYNGRSFDLPLLRDRLHLARLPELPNPPHWDVLHAARRLWGEGAGGASLRVLQAEVLGAPRSGDVPGEWIPALYREWLEGDGQALDGVCAHNREDLFALGELAARLAAALADGVRPGMPAPVLRGLARAYERAGDPERAIAGHLARGGREASLEAARLLKRLGRASEAAPLWDAARAGPIPSVEAAIELAKDLEHRRRDPGAALRVVRETLRGSPWIGEASRRALEQRLRRLCRKTGEPWDGPAQG